MKALCGQLPQASASGNDEAAKAAAEEKFKRLQARTWGVSQALLWVSHARLCCGVRSGLSGAFQGQQACAFASARACSA